MKYKKKLKLRKQKKLKVFDEILKESLSKGILKTSNNQLNKLNKFEARYSISCCVIHGNYSLKDMINMRLKIDKYIKEDERKMKEIVSIYKLLFCLEAMEKYYHMVHSYVFNCSNYNEDINEIKIKKSCIYIIEFIKKLSEFPDLPDSVIRESEKILKEEQIKRFFNKLYKNAYSTEKKQN